MFTAIQQQNYTYLTSRAPIKLQPRWHHRYKHFIISYTFFKHLPPFVLHVPLLSQITAIRESLNQAYFDDDNSMNFETLDDFLSNPTSPLTGKVSSFVHMHKLIASISCISFSSIHPFPTSFHQLQHTHSSTFVRHRPFGSGRYLPCYVLH